MTNGKQSAENGNTGTSKLFGSDDPEIIAIVEDVIKQVRLILNSFESLVYDVWELIKLLGNLVDELRSYFRTEKPQQRTQAA